MYTNLIDLSIKGTNMKIIHDRLFTWKRTGSIHFGMPLVTALMLALILLSTSLAVPVNASGATNFLLKWGGMGTGESQFYSLFGVAVDSAENVYATDRDNNRVQKFTSTGTLLGWWGRGSLTTGWHGAGSPETQGFSGTGEGEFISALGISVDASDNVYVADATNNRIQKFDSTGGFLGWLGYDGTSTGWHSPGSFQTGVFGLGDGQFNYPSDVDTDSAGNIFVIDQRSYRVQKFDSSGTFLGWWGRGTVTTGWHAPGSGETGVPGTADGQFQDYYGSGPTSLTVDLSGNVYVADTFNRRIQKFTNNGVFIMKWGTWGDEDGQFQFPYGLDVDFAGNVYVADLNNCRVQKWDSSGTFLGWWGLGYSAATYDITYAGWHDPLAGERGANGFGDGEFSTSPIDVAVGPTGNIYVADVGLWRIQKFGFPTDVSIAKSASKDKVTTGSPLSYSLMITNNGPNPAYGVEVTETYPAGFTFNNANPVPDSGNNQWDLGNIAAGDNRTIAISGTVTGGGTLTNVAAVAALTDDLNTNDNSTSVSTDVILPVKVGGEVNPVNKNSLLLPWIALALIIGIGCIYLIKRKTKDQN